MANLLSRNMCAEEHPPRVCAVSREAGLSPTGHQDSLEGDEWKSCTNKRSNRPSAYCPQSKGLATLLWRRIGIPMTSARPPFVRKMHTSRRLNKPELHIPDAGCGAPHCCSPHAASWGEVRYTVKLRCRVQEQTF